MSKQFCFKQISLACTQFISVWPINRTLSGVTTIWERWQWRGTLNYTKLQHYWNINIRLFWVLSRSLVGVGSYPAAEKSVYSAAPANWTTFPRVLVRKRMYSRDWNLNAFTLRPQSSTSAIIPGSSNSHEKYMLFHALGVTVFIVVNGHGHPILNLEPGCLLLIRSL